MAQSNTKVGQMNCETCGHAAWVKQTSGGKLAYKCDGCGSSHFTEKGDRAYHKWKAAMTPYTYPQAAASEPPAAAPTTPKAPAAAAPKPAPKAPAAAAPKPAPAAPAPEPAKRPASSVFSLGGL